MHLVSTCKIMTLQRRAKKTNLALESEM